MDVNIDPGSSPLLNCLAAIVLLTAIASNLRRLLSSDNQHRAADGISPTFKNVAFAIAFLVLLVARVGFGPGPAPTPSPPVRTVVASTQSSSITPNQLNLMPIAPRPGEVIKNPARFEWQISPSIYYIVEIRDTEPDRDYERASGWMQSGVYEVNLPDQAIGNLEWRLSATINPNGGRIVQTGWSHFTFDPFKDNKERKDSN